MFRGMCYVPIRWKAELRMTSVGFPWYITCTGKNLPVRLPQNKAVIKRLSVVQSL